MHASIHIELERAVKLGLDFTGDGLRILAKTTQKIYTSNDDDQNLIILQLLTTSVYCRM